MPGFGRLLDLGLKSQNRSNGCEECLSDLPDTPGFEIPSSLWGWDEGMKKVPRRTAAALGPFLFSVASKCPPQAGDSTGLPGSQGAPSASWVTED